MIKRSGVVVLCCVDRRINGGLPAIDLGGDYMANFSPVRGLEFCCDYMLSPGAKFEIAREESSENEGRFE